MKVHELKTVNPYFEQLWMKHKNFEVRKNDREDKFRIGDVLNLREYRPQVNHLNYPDKIIEEGHYTNKNILVVITYILDNPEYCKDGYVIIGFKEIHRN